MVLGNGNKATSSQDVAAPPVGWADVSDARLQLRIRTVMCFFPLKCCPTLLPPWGNVFFSVYWKISFWHSLIVCQQRENYRKKRWSSHIIRHLCWRKGFFFKGCWKWNWWWRNDVTWCRFHYGDASFQEVTFVWQHGNVKGGAQESSRIRQQRQDESVSGETDDFQWQSEEMCLVFHQVSNETENK